MHVRLKDREPDDLGFLTCRRLLEELVEKTTRCGVDPNPSP